MASAVMLKVNNILAYHSHPYHCNRTALLWLFYHTSIALLSYFLHVRLQYSTEQMQTDKQKERLSKGQMTSKYSMPTVCSLELLLS